MSRVSQDKAGLAREVGSAGCADRTRQRGVPTMVGSRNVPSPLTTADATTPVARRCGARCQQRIRTWLQVTALVLAVALSFMGVAAFGQTAVKVPKPEEKDKAEKAVKKQQEKEAQRTDVIEFRGQAAFKEKDLRSVLKEQITTIDQYGLTAARGDDAAFFLELFYRKHGYAKVTVRYSIQGNRLLLDINEGPLVSLGFEFCRQP